MKQNQTRNVSSKKLRRILHKLFNKSYCGTKNSAYLCSVHHLIQARRLAKFAAGIFYVLDYSYSSVPCGALMRPQPVSGGEQRGAELFSYPIETNPVYSF